MRRRRKGINPSEGAHQCPERYVKGGAYLVVRLRLVTCLSQVGNFSSLFSLSNAIPIGSCRQRSADYASEIQKDYLRPAGVRLELQTNGLPAKLGWHTFRHTYRSLLDATGAPIRVQQKLMRHAQVATTMDVYGNALMESKREANSKVVSLLLRIPKNPETLQE